MSKVRIYEIVEVDEEGKVLKETRKRISEIPATDGVYLLLVEDGLEAEHVKRLEQRWQETTQGRVETPLVILSGFSNARLIAIRELPENKGGD
jgi:hypothetical protein